MFDYTRALARMSATPNLQITEIFCSIQGESALVGWPTVFVRLTGCPLRCQYCDTAYAFHGGRKLALAEALAAVQAHQGIRHVCVTGGEPLAQPASLPLMGALCDAGYVVSLETSGALDISAVDARVQRVLDLKTPGSGEQARNRWSNIDLLQPHDQIKFVLCGRDDFDWAMEQIGTRGLSERRHRQVRWAAAAPDQHPIPQKDAHPRDCDLHRLQAR